MPPPRAVTTVPAAASREGSYAQVAGPGSGMAMYGVNRPVMAVSSSQRRDKAPRRVWACRPMPLVQLAMPLKVQYSRARRMVHPAR